MDPNSTEEIEITADMIDAGAAIIARFNDEHDDPMDIAAKVYRVMVNVLRLSDTHHKI